MDTRHLDGETDRELRVIAQRAVVMASLIRSELAMAYRIDDANSLNAETGDANMPFARDAREKLLASIYARQRTAERPDLEGDLISGVRREEFGWELDVARRHMRDVGVPRRLWEQDPRAPASFNERWERDGSRPLTDAAAWSVSEMREGHALLRDSLGVGYYETKEHGPRSTVARLVHVDLPAHLELAGAKVDVELDAARADIDAAKRRIMGGEGLDGVHYATKKAREMGQWVRPHLKFGAGDFLGLGGGTMAEPGMIEATVSVGRQGAAAQAVREGIGMPQRAGRSVAAAARMFDEGRSVSR